MTTAIGILAGFFLSWLELEGLRRTSRKILQGGNLGSAKWAFAFGARWIAFALLFWFLLHLLRGSLLFFVGSFLLSNFVLRHGYGKVLHA